MLSARHWCAPLSALIKYGAHWSTYYHSAHHFHQSMTIFTDKSCRLFAMHFRIFLSKKCILIFFLTKTIFAGKTRKNTRRIREDNFLLFWADENIWQDNYFKMALHFFLSLSFYICRIFTLKPRDKRVKVRPGKTAILFLSFTRSRFLSRLNQYVIEYYLYRTERINILIFTGLFTSTYSTLRQIHFSKF